MLLEVAQKCNIKYVLYIQKLFSVSHLPWNINNNVNSNNVVVEHQNESQGPFDCWFTSKYQKTQVKTIQLELG